MFRSSRTEAKGRISRRAEAFVWIPYGLLAAIVVLLIAAVASAATDETSPVVDGADIAVSASEEPITPIAVPVPDDPRKVALGAQLFGDPRLSARNARSCASCHDLGSNGGGPATGLLQTEAGPLRDILTVFNASLSFRLNWKGNFRTFEAQTAASIGNPKVMGGNMEEVVAKLSADRMTSAAFEAIYGSGPSRDSILDAMAAFEGTLVTPGSRFDRWLQGDERALTSLEREGYREFKTLGCVSCHQGVNIGGNLFQRHGIFAPLASREPEILRVPSLRNVAVTAPYFHDGSAQTLEQAVYRMARSQLNVRLEHDQVTAITAFLQTLTGQYQGRPLKAQEDK